MKAHTAKKFRVQLGSGSKITAFLLALLGASGSVQAATSVNLLGDPGFDVNPLQDFTTVLNNFAAQQGKWGSEVGTIVTGTSSDGVVPNSAPSMLSMTNADGGVTTQTAQVIDVTAFAAAINAGDATFDLEAMFTTGKGYSGADAGIVAMFFMNSSYYSPNTPAQMSAGKALDADVGWETVSLHGAIPVGTQWMAVQVLYSDASLASDQSGYVDSASLTITTIPESSSYALLGLGAGALLVRRRR